MKTKALLVLVCFICPLFLAAQSNYADTSDVRQYPGLGKAASGIFFSEKPYSMSGFAELNTVLTPTFDPDKDALQDIELYYQNLIRTALFFGYRINQQLILNSELQLEYLRAGDESHTELNFELFMDYRIAPFFNLRAGFHPLSIGYINTNDEPILFYSVNRPESERIILPSTWIELGLAAYGTISPSFNYFISLATGIDATEFKSATWVRNGREAFDMNALALVTQLNYTAPSSFGASISTYAGSNGTYSYEFEGKKGISSSELAIISAYAKYSPRNFRLLASSTWGRLLGTEGIYKMTLHNTGIGQVLGRRTYGHYFEAGVDILHWIWPNRASKETHFYDYHEMALPLFVRVEVLNTHASIKRSLQTLPYNQNHLRIIAMGLNFNLKEDVVIKANYQFRKNLTMNSNTATTGNYIEMGVGMNF